MSAEDYFDDPDYCPGGEEDWHGGHFGGRTQESCDLQKEIYKNRQRLKVFNNKGHVHNWIYQNYKIGYVCEGCGLDINGIKYSINNITNHNEGEQHMFYQPLIQTNQFIRSFSELELRKLARVGIISSDAELTSNGKKIVWDLLAVKCKDELLKYTDDLLQEYREDSMFALEGVLGNQLKKQLPSPVEDAKIIDAE